MDELVKLYEKWASLYAADQLTRGQQAALTRAWNQFAEKAGLLGYDPFELSEKLAQLSTHSEPLG